VKLFVGITDGSWYRQLSEAGPDEVNFWKPGAGGSFGTLAPGELFLFKLHAPNNYIVGGGHFVKFSRLPMSLAWLAFGEKNGVRSRSEFLSRIHFYRRSTVEPDPEIGCIVLAEPFWFPQDQWIAAPSDWPKSTVQGKTYDALEGRGYELWAQVQERLGRSTSLLRVAEDSPRYGQALVDVRLGQGAFRVLVTDAYERRCAITGEKTLPVLEAAHIKPYAAEGPHRVENGLLLRADMHILFDKGLLTVTPDYEIQVSSQIQEQYTNGKLYYSYHGQELRTLPAHGAERPSGEFLEWHNGAVFVP
jgi:putative restriction endonuclease